MERCGRSLSTVITVLARHRTTHLVTDRLGGSAGPTQLPASTAPRLQTGSDLPGDQLDTTSQVSRPGGLEDSSGAGWFYQTPDQPPQS